MNAGSATGCFERRGEGTRASSPGWCVALLCVVLGITGPFVDRAAAQNVSTAPQETHSASSGGRGGTDPSVRLCDASHDPAAYDASRVDVRGLSAVYCASSPAVRVPLDVAHASSYPAFYVLVPASWLGAWALRDDGDYTDAYRLTVTQLATYGTVTGLKRLVGRPRPYVKLPLTSRSSRYADPNDAGAYESFPSGHASLSFALATSWSLSHPKWYVVAPSLTWASLVTASRLRLGVHYPSDVLAGAVLGAGIATSVHLLRDAITPNAFRPDDPEAAMTSGPTVRVNLRF